MQINTHRADDTLTLVLTGRLDTMTAPVLAGELRPDGIRHVVLDFGACPYISSVGLRELLRAQKRLTAIGGTILLINVTREVQDVLDMTGFPRLIPSRRKVREISIDGLEFVSAGVCGECYRLDRETLVKLYNEGIGADVAEKVKEFAKAAFVSGIPTGISYDVVACGTRTGVRCWTRPCQLGHLKRPVQHRRSRPDARGDFQDCSRDPGRSWRNSRHQGESRQLH